MREFPRLKVCKMESTQLFMKEKYKQKKVKRGRGQAKRSQGEKMERRKKARRRKKKRRNYLDLGESGLSHFEEDFLKF